jgi:cytochrome c5
MSGAASPTLLKVADVQRNHDMVFMRQFSMVIGGLVLLTVVLILLGIWLNSSQPREESAVAQSRVEERIRPVGGVYAGDTGRAAMAAAAEAAREAAAAQVAYGGSTDGGYIYQQLCGACHTSGAGGAPTLVAAQWTDRIAQGMDTLTQHAIDGYQGPAGLMPARGGNPSLTDEQVEVTVAWMVDNLK